MVVKIIGLFLVAGGVLLVYCPLFGNGGICGSCDGMLSHKGSAKKEENFGLASKPE